jgi:hypothetical protein
MGDAVVVAEFAEGIPAALRTAIRTNCSRAIGALRHGSLATRHPNVVISEFNLTVQNQSIPTLANVATGQRADSELLIGRPA